MLTRVELICATEADLLAASVAMQSARSDEPATNRLEQGLRVACAWDVASGRSVDVLEERRLELAYARVIARAQAGRPDHADLGSVDFARMILVDASLQREGEWSMDMDAMDRNQWYSWSNGAIVTSPWYRAEVSPTEMTYFRDEDLGAIASGRFEDLPALYRQGIELMLLRAATPRDPEFERELHNANEGIGKNGTFVSAHQPGADVEQLTRRGDALDRERFGARPAEPKLNRAEMRGVVDRLVAATMNDLHGVPFVRGGKNMFEPDPAKVDLAKAAVAAAAKGHVDTRLQRIARIALEHQQEQGLRIDKPAEEAMAKAAVRLVSENLAGLSDVRAAKRLVVDAGLQRVAAETLASDGGWGAQAPAAKMVRDILGQDAPVFTRLAVEREDTEAVATGRFERLGDARGIGNAVKMALHRSSGEHGREVEIAFERLAKANPVGKKPDLGWIDKRAEAASKQDALRVFSRGPEWTQVALPIKGHERD